ncbi:MAG: lysoplasmalogenase [Spirochaetes bacterium]|nr:lysoplasmalogenase [Spirochaetota bacterium]MBX3722246.1 lysoplasmalogenase [Turneriella sp.]
MEIRLLIFIALVSAAILTKLTWQKGYRVFKLLPLLFIFALAFLRPQNVDTLWLAAISFGLAGDALLLSEKGFVPGLASFLLGHVFYILAFARETGGFFYTPPLLLGVGSVVIGVSSYFVRHLLQSRQKKYIVPVIIYTFVSGLFVLNAFRFPFFSYAVCGAVCFGLSDFLLAFNKFIRPSWYVQAAVSLTYYGAQWMLALHFRSL